VSEQAILTDGRITLRALGVADVSPTYVSWLNDPEVTAFTEIEAGTADIKSAKKYVENSNVALDALLWGIFIGAQEKHVGNFRLGAINKRHRRASAAILIGDRTVWGHGIAPAAIQLATKYGFENLNLEKIYANVVEKNLPSRRAFEKAGFHLEATLQRHAILGDEITSVWMMAIFRNECF